MDSATETISFFVTAGRGTESFAANEIIEKLNPCQIYVQDGKVFFKLASASDRCIQRILTLRSVERVFVTIADYDNFPYIQTKRTFLDKLMSTLSARENFFNATAVLSQLTSLTNINENIQKRSILNCVHTSTVDAPQAKLTHNVHHFTVTPKQENLLKIVSNFSVQEKVTTGCPQDFETSFLSDNEPAAKRIKLDGSCYKSVTVEESISKPDYEKQNKNECISNFNQQTSSDYNRQTIHDCGRQNYPDCSRQTYPDCSRQTSPYLSKQSDPDHIRQTIPDKLIDNDFVLSRNNAVTMNEKHNNAVAISEKCNNEVAISEKCNNEVAISEKHNALAISEKRNAVAISEKCNSAVAMNKKHQTCCSKCISERDSEHNDTSSLLFRMSIKCSGKVSKWINLKKLSRDLGWRVARATGWTTELRQPQMEVCLHVSDGHVTSGVPLTRFPLSRRVYLGDSGLRAPIAWIMNELASIKAGDIVLDPMCGKATILIEAATEIGLLGNAWFIGSDRDASQIDRALQNLSTCDCANTTSLLKADGLNMPYRNACLDVVVCDAPFNQNHLFALTPQMFYYKFLTEIYRVLRPQGRCVLLTSEQLKHTVLLMVEGAEEKQTQKDNFPSEGATSQMLVKGSKTHKDCYEARNAIVPLTFVSSHYVKLGETHACIIVLRK